jgi:putative ABC transport system permease protein
MTTKGLLIGSFILAVQALRAQRLRSFLSVLGVTIGIFAIIFVFTVLDSLEQKLRGSIQEIGNNVVYIQKWPWSFSSDYPWWKYLNRPLPSISEYQIIKSNSQTTGAVAFQCAQGSVRAYRASAKLSNAKLVGISADYTKLKTLNLETGRFFSDADLHSAEPYAVIGFDIAKGLFNNQSPLQQQFKISGQTYRVLGVLKKEGESMFGESSDFQILIPYKQAYKFMDISKEESDPTIMVKPKSNISTAQMMSELRGILRSQRRIKPTADDNFALNETRILQKGFDDLFAMVGTAGWIIGGFSILVGGFGIANMMFVSVRERTSQIGIQKSLGSPKAFILYQFLWESIMLSIMGGLIGIGIVALIIVIARWFSDFTLSLTFSNVNLALCISLIVGVLSGFLPAYHAAQLDPVEAIRSNA